MIDRLWEGGSYVPQEAESKTEITVEDVVLLESTPVQEQG